MQSTPVKSVFLWIAALLALAIVALYALAGAELARHGTTTRAFGWTTTFDASGFTVSGVTSGGPADGQLRPGDRLIAMNGHEIGCFGTELMRAALSEGEPFTLRVARGPDFVDVPLVSPQYQHFPENAAHAALRLLAGLVYLAFAIVLALQPMAQRPVRIACLLFFGMALVMLGLALSLVDTFLQGTLFATYVIALSLVPLTVALGYDFAYSFPPGTPKSRPFNIAQYALYALAAAFLVPAVLKSTAAIGNVPEASLVGPSHPMYFWSFTLFAPVFIAGMFAVLCVLVRNYRVVRDPDGIRRARWVVFGTTAAAVLLLAIILSAIATALFSGRPVARILLSSAVLDFTVLVSLLTPASIAYAVVKHQALDVEVVVRRSVRYALAKGLLQVALLLPVIGVAGSILVNPNRTFADLFRAGAAAFYVPLAAGALAAFAYRGRLSGWVDRRFFREAYDRERVFVELIDELKRIGSPAEAAARAAAGIERALHPERLYVLLRNARGDLAVEHAPPGDAPTGIAGESSLARALGGCDSAVDARELSHLVTGDDEAQLLERLGVALVVPMVGLDGRLSGVFLLGKRRSEEPYGPGDRALLEALGAQLAIASDNVGLRRRVAREEQLRHDVLGRLDANGVGLMKECPECGRCYDTQASRCDDDGTLVDLSIPFERTIDGKYRLDRLLGKGGMGSVYEATDIRLGRSVALKVLVGRDYGTVAAMRFEREARASARLSHPNIVTVFDYGVVGQDGAYLVMERLDGMTLREALARCGRLEPRVAANWFDQILAGVAAAHAAGVVHRDLKPENVFVTGGAGETRVLKVLDFGLAKLRLDEQPGEGSLTAPGTVMGTLVYMSPEQLAGRNVDHRADLFAVGVMAFEALAGRRPYRGTTWSEMMAAMHRGPEAFTMGSTSDPLEAVLHKALALDPFDRHTSAEAMRIELVPALAACTSVDDAGSTVDDETPTQLDDEAQTMLDVADAETLRLEDG